MSTKAIVTAAIIFVVLIFFVRHANLACLVIFRKTNQASRWTQFRLTPVCGYSTASSEPWSNLCAASHIAAFIVLSDWPCLSGHLAEELLVGIVAKNYAMGSAKIHEEVCCPV